YHPGSGQLVTLVAPGNEQLDFTYDGFLTTDVTWSGTVNGTVEYGYNADFRTETLSVNGSGITFAYDDDGLLTQAGSLVLVRDATNGSLDATVLGVVETDSNINTFGELDDLAATVSGSEAYAVDY